MNSFVSGLAAVAALLFGVACNQHEPAPAQQREPRPAAVVQVARISSEGLQGTEEVVGTVRAKLRATLEAKVSGRIAQLDVSLGDAVEKGQLIAVLEVAEMQAKLAQADAVLAQAKTEHERMVSLLEKGAATRQSYDDAATRYEVAQASVREVRSVLDYARVTAPFAGVVTHKLVEVGDLATPGRPLVELAEPTALRFEAAVPETLSRFVGVGASVQVAVAALEQPIEATVAEVAPSIDPNSRTLLIKLDLPRNDQLRAGQFGRALVPTGRTQVLQLPQKAVVLRGQMELVFVVVEGTARMRLVKTGKHVGDRVEVVAGVEPGEQVVVRGAAQLVDGQAVQVQS